MNKELQRMKMSQDALYEYLTAHDVKVIRIAELMNKTPQAIISCFRHHNNAHGYPRRFSVENIKLLNQVLVQIAQELRDSILVFGTNQMYTNRHGRTYDPGLLAPIKRVGTLLNLIGLTNRLFGWNKTKKSTVLSDPCSKVYGNITEDMVTKINAEILAVAGVLECVELVPDDNAYKS